MGKAAIVEHIFLDEQNQLAVTDVATETMDDVVDTKLLNKKVVMDVVYQLNSDRFD